MPLVAHSSVTAPSIVTLLVCACDRETLCFQLASVTKSQLLTWCCVPGSFQDIREGEPVELLVVATQASFGDFKALKEAYLPESSLWVADYPYVDRDAFLDISLEIERARADSQPSVYTNGSSRTSNSAAFRP